jgi:hypothetical protein
MVPEAVLDAMNIGQHYSIKIATYPVLHGYTVKSLPPQ